jgi:hypothetical protein
MRNQNRDLPRGKAFVIQGLLGGLLLGLTTTAQAFPFEFGEFKGSLDNAVSLGATWRAEDPDERLIAKSNLNPGLCIRRNPDNSFSGNGCNSTSDPSLNAAYVAAPGSFAINGDNGNLNYDKGDLVAGAAKLTSDLNLSWRGLGLFARGSYFYDAVNTNFDEQHPDTTFQPAETSRPRSVEKLLGNDLIRLDTYVFGTVPFIGDRQLTIRVGEQAVNWGESTFLILNSINSINPPSAPALRSPGFDVKELLIPVGMVFMGTEIMPNLSIEGFYQYKFEPVIPDPVGGFFSTSDTFGAGGEYAMLSFGKVPEDPTQSYDPALNPDDATGLLGSSSRTILRGEDREPKDGGQYGFKLSYFAENFNGGTEMAFYHTNTHSRFPIASLIASDASCANTATNAVEFVLGCGAPGSGLASGRGTNGNGYGRLMFSGGASGNDPLPVETAQVFAEFPEDIRLYGLSFNTTIGDWAWAGEVAYRPNQPLQIHSVDLVLASVNPAFPAADIPLGPAGTIPGRRSAAPDFVETRYRGNPVQPNQYIQGYESMKVANYGMTLLNTVSASNPFKADQILIVFELGATQVFDMPGIDELQFNAAGAVTHASNGADGTGGVGTDELGGSCVEACRQNPTAQDERAFADEFAWGFRNVYLFRYQDAFMGANLEPLIGIFKDVDGIAPGPGENFIEGRNTYLLGLRFDYLNKWSGEARYTIENGAGIDNGRIDRDIYSLSVRYEF